MADLILRDTDRDELVRDITAAVFASVRDAMAELHEPRLVDGDRMAELAGIARPTLDRLVRADVVPSVTVGRRRLFLPADVIGKLTTNENTPTDR